MTRIAFLIPGTQGRLGVPSTPHVGVACLAAYVRAHAYDPHVIDLRVEPMSFPRLKSRLQAIGARWVAITSTSFGYKKVYELINVISGWGYQVVYGGPHVSIVREKIFDGCEPYAAVYGEGELTLTALLSGNGRGEVPGIIYRDDNGEVVENPPAEAIADLDALPFPAYELSKMHLYAEKKIPLTTSRECPCRCTYCCVGLVMGTGFRARSPENVVEEIELWHQRGYRFFGINDDNFTADMVRAERICDLMIERVPDIAWELRTGIRVDRVSESLLAKMKSAGCIFLAYGIESIDDSVLKAARKGITRNQIDAAVTAAERVGIPFSGFFMIGLPGDTYDKFQELYQFAQRHRFDEVRFYNLDPLPNTAVFEWVLRNGRMLSSPEEYLNDTNILKNKPQFETDEFTFAERVKATDLGDYLVVRKLLEKTFGARMGAFLSVFARLKQVRTRMLGAGFLVASRVRRIHLGKIMFLRSSGKDPVANAKAKPQ